MRPKRLHTSTWAALHEAAGHRGYCLLTCGYFVCGFHVAFIAVHLPAYITDEGLSSEIAAWAIAIVGLANVAGAFLAGIAGGRWSKKNCLCVLYASRAVVIALFVTVPTTVPSVLLFALVMGFLWLST